MKTIRNIEYLDGVKALVHVDFNVPIEAGAIKDDFRIRAALSTIEFLRDKGAVVILMSHLESADGTNPSLEPVAKHLEKLGVPVTFVADYKKAAEMIAQPADRESSTSEEVQRGLISGEDEDMRGPCFLLENLRFFPGEKSNDPRFAEELASLADIYVNDAFSVSHREHASVVGVPRHIPSYAGFQLEKEIANLSKVFDPSHPFLFILGGAKFETKMPLVERFSKTADAIFIGGALANDLLKAQGKQVGASKVSSSDLDLSAIAADPKVFSCVDVAIANDGNKDIDHIDADDVIADVGEKTVALLQEKIATAAFILWNGPFGIYEKGFTWGTEECARLISENSSATTIVGGGDTLAAIAKLGIEEKFSFVSTGGGAMLDFLAQGTLPGIVALGD